MKKAQALIKIQIVECWIETAWMFFTQFNKTLYKLFDLIFIHLVGVPFVLREEGSGTRTVMENKLNEVGISPESFNVVMTLGSTESVKRAVQAGVGISIVSERAAQNELKLGLIEVASIRGIELSRDFYIVRRKHKVQSHAVEAFDNFLVQ